ncbi:hypothetical protein [Streptomyces sp. NBC_00207]|uniref:hypothetical protein n=1 Tax=Streptomyces sp. NBC_00207 TaxID=2903635 RepID=UPI0032501F67
MATETVLSPLLCDLPEAKAPTPPARPADPDFAESLASGLTETFGQFTVRMADLLNVDPADPDAESKRAALRQQLCLARGVAPADICPVMGYDLSADAFRRAKGGWVEHLKAHRPSDWTYAEHDRARGFWANARSDLIHEWPEVER